MGTSNSAQLIPPAANRDSYTAQLSVQPQYQPVASLNAGIQPSASKSSTKVIAMGVVALVAIVAGILIFASGNDSQPEQAEPSSAQVTPSDSDAYEEPVGTIYSPTEAFPSWDDFPGWYRSNFLDACVGESTYALCVCALETIEENFSLDEVLEVEAAGLNGEDVSWFYNAIAAECT